MKIAASVLCFGGELDNCSTIVDTTFYQMISRKKFHRRISGDLETKLPFPS